ncbi:KAT6B-like protein [Mya arenaria]|uniref:KAT6B-like protein n=1 Tax=Mya arenaria TaxID=6604 RepID=A0ABY7FSD0_MYAAR|nr:histone acetyltransferase KAT6B-like [Mya arenaria]WAR23708.1 KAT6B-like protein [Mya arenaria]
MVWTVTIILENLYKMASSRWVDHESARTWILSIIDQLRQRKARPDLERICHFVERKHGLDRKDAEAHLEKLVDDGTVIKVVYKRGTSYRNATKAKKRAYVSNVLNSKGASQRINEAINALLDKRRYHSLDTESTHSSNGGENVDEKENESSAKWTENDGVSSTDIELWIASKHGDIGPYPIHWLLQREVDAGNVTLLKNGNFLLRTESDSPDSPEAEEDVTPQPPPPAVVSKRGRPPKRKHDNMVRSFSWAGTGSGGGGKMAAIAGVEPESAPVPEMPPHLCDFCQQTSENNKRGEREELLFCKDCNAKAHPSCMNYSPELAARARNTDWQCIDCKVCCLCTDPDDPDLMLFCDACDKGYHMQCHVPEVVDKPQGKWVCNDCVMDGVQIDDVEENVFTNVVDSTMKTDSESLASARNGDRASEEAEEAYPDAASWDTDDVARFFRGKGFPDQADSFKEQEIDGQSLLLLKRSDVLQGLSLKLGPALKIYKHVMKLQTTGISNT